MGFINIRYNDGRHRSWKAFKYKGVELSLNDIKEKKIFNSGDFVKDWYDMRKDIITSEYNEPYYGHSSSVDNFIMDGAPFDSAYLHMEGEIPVLKYLDRTKEDWWRDDHITKGIEFFVPEGTTPTWKELKQLVKDK